jgi:hypothetical protein
MEKLFKMSDLGVLHYYLGIEVKKKDGGLILTQSNYAQRILEKAGMEGRNPCRIPMEPKMKLSKESSSPLVDATFYRSVVGSLRYFVNTRPDIAFVVDFVSRFIQEPYSCWYPIDRVPLSTGFKTRQIVGRASMRYHMPYSSRPCPPTEIGSGTAMCPMTLDLASRLRWTPVLPRVIWIRTSPPS